MQTVPRLIQYFIPNNYKLSINLDRPERKFSGTISIHGAVPADDGEIRLHSKDLEIDSITFDGKTAEWSEQEFDQLVITHSDIKPGEHTLVITYHGTITDSMHGLYPSYFEVDGQKKEFLATQFESHHAREVFPCVDEPEAKASFDLTLTAEQNVTVLSNMPIVDQSKHDDRLVTKFDTTPRMSTYLLAFATGEMQKKTSQTKNGVEVNVYATHAQAPESLDFALDHAVKSIDFYEDYFGVEYPLPKSDHLALPDFSSGAMENWGLITYREIALLADPKNTSIDSKHYIATVISHELAHMWFGNLVTMKWWNNLWLNESFATLMEYLAVDAIWPDWNIWLDFAGREAVMALRRDAIDGVQAVQVDVNHPDEISSLFDGAIVYAKGARLLRMLQQYVGDDNFRAGLSSYFKEFAYQNTEAEDLWRHIAKASAKDISTMMNTWISQSGYPVVHVSPDSLRQEQFFIGDHKKSNKLWAIPLGAQSKEDVPELLDVEKLNFPIADDERLNVSDSAHFITNYPVDHLQKLLDNLDNIDELGRLQLLHEQTLLVRGGYTSSAQLIDILQAYRHETSDTVWDMMALVIGELKKFVFDDQAAEDALRRLAGSLASELYQKLGWEQSADESESDTKLRSTILGLMAYSEQPEVLAEIDKIYQTGIANINPEIRSLIISSVAKRADDIAVIEQLLNDYRSTVSSDLREDICAGLTSVKQDDQIKLILSQFKDRQTVKPQDLFRWFAYMARSRYGRHATWQWLTSNWDWIMTTFAGDKSYDDFPRYAAGGPMTDDEFQAYREFFNPMRDIPALRRTIDLGNTEIKARLDLLARDGQSVKQKLRDI